MSASVLRYWRESASLILVGKASAACLAASSNPTSQQVQSQNSTNITSFSSSNDYKILMLQRSSKMSFFPNFYVFPGGAADESDFSSEWLDILGPSYKLRTGSYSPKETLFRLFSQESENNQRASIFSRKRDPKYSVIPSDIALRICAIRETFEETGILLARKAEPEILEEEKHSDDKELTRRRCTAKLYNLPEEELNKWRQSVLKSSDNFLKMCRDLSIVPDLTTLSEWSNWLTPISAKSEGRKPKRFNTIFFISFVDHLPRVMIETQEATNYKWQSPSEYFSQMMSGSIHLGPPQLYELNYMNFSNWDAFHDEVESHPHFHAQQWMPVRASCKDGLLFVFPGDDKYPKDVNLEELRQNFEFPMNKQEFFNSNHINNHFDLEEFEFKRNLPFSKLRAQPLKNSTIEKMIKSKL